MSGHHCATHCLRTQCVPTQATIGNAHKVVRDDRPKCVSKVQAMIQEYFEGEEQCNSITANENRALGAAMQAAIRTGGGSFQVQDLLPMGVTGLSASRRKDDGVPTSITPLVRQGSPCRARSLDVWVGMLLPLHLPDGVSQIQPQCCCCAEAASLPGEEEVPMGEDGCCRGISPTACCMFPSQYCCCVGAVAMPCDEEVPMLFHKFQPQCCRCVGAAALPGARFGALSNRGRCSTSSCLC